MNEPKKAIGQHWLNDEVALKAIVDAAEVVSGESLFEIGPGQGVLTDELLARGAKVTALELDNELVKNLFLRYAIAEDRNTENRVRILEGDIRTFDLRQLPVGYKIVANIPYYLTSNLVRLLGETSNKPERAVLLVQKEVAERICAKPGQMSVLSVVAQWYFRCSLGVLVPAKSFTPPPKVDSQVVILRTRQEPLVKPEKEKAFFRMVKAGFSAKRKKLRSSLAGGLGISKREVEELLANTKISPDARAEDLAIGDWLRLLNS
jgi:16S rRNA (adenine1518-N6/adenine1519-N6)-dimethyltransferase